MPQHRIVETEGVLELAQAFFVALYVHENVMGLVHLLDRVRHLTASPVFEPVNPAVAGGNHALVALDHRGDLLALIGVNDEDDLVVPHRISLWVTPPACETVEQGSNQPGCTTVPGMLGL